MLIGGFLVGDRTFDFTDTSNLLFIHIYSIHVRCEKQSNRINIVRSS